MQLEIGRSPTTSAPGQRIPGWKSAHDECVAWKQYIMIAKMAIRGALLLFRNSNGRYLEKRQRIVVVSRLTWDPCEKMLTCKFGSVWPSDGHRPRNEVKATQHHTKSTVSESVTDSILTCKPNLKEIWLVVSELWPVTGNEVKVT